MCDRESFAKIRDAVCEAALDTVFLPFDWTISAYRKRKDREDE